MKRCVAGLGFLAGYLALAPCASAGQSSAAPASSGATDAVTKSLAANDFQQALNLLLPELRARPKDAQLWTLHGMALNGLGRSVDSLTSFRRALRYRPDYLPALLGAAEIEYRTARPEACPRLEKIVSLGRGLPTAYAMLAVLEFERANYARSVIHFEKAEAEIRKDPLALWQYGQSLYLSGQASRAADVFAALVALEPDRAEPRFNLALTRYESGRWTETVDALRPLAEHPSPGGDVLRLLAAALEKGGHTPDAVQVLRRAIELYPREEENYLDLASLCIDHQSYDLGFEILGIALRHIPDSSRVLAARGVYYARLGKIEEAERDFLTADSLDPGKKYGKIGLSAAKLDAGQTAESIRLLRGQLHTNPADPEVRWLLAEALVRSGAGPGTPEYREAQSLVERAVTARPNLTEAKVLLAKLLLRSGDRAKAVALLETAVRQDPRNRTAIYLLSHALRQSGRAAEAQEYLARFSVLVEEDRRLEVQKNRIRLVKAAPTRETAH